MFLLCFFLHENLFTIHYDNIINIWNNYLIISATLSADVCDTFTLSIFKILSYRRRPATKADESLSTRQTVTGLDPVIEKPKPTSPLRIVIF